MISDKDDINTGAIKLVGLAGSAILLVLVGIIEFFGGDSPADVADDRPGTDELNCVTMPLHCALRDKDEPSIWQMLQDKNALKYRDGWGRSPLHWCVLRKGGLCLNNREFYPVLNKLLKGGADPNSTNKTGETILFDALVQNDLRAARMLIKHGANPRGEIRYRNFRVPNAYASASHICYLFLTAHVRAEKANKIALRFLMNQGIRLDGRCNALPRKDKADAYLWAEYRRLHSRK